MAAVTIQYPPDATPPVDDSELVFAYDEAGRLASVTAGANTVQYEYEDGEVAGAVPGLFQSLGSEQMGLNGLIDLGGIVHEAVEP